MTTSCPACGVDIIEAAGPGGGNLLLHPRPSPRGKFAVRDSPGGGLLARLITPSAPVQDHESRHNGHTCAGRGGNLQKIREKTAEAAANARRERGKWRPRTGLAAASGVRVPAPGDRS